MNIHEYPCLSCLELGIAVGQVLLTTNMSGLELSAPALGDKGSCCVLSKEPFPGLRRAAAPAPNQLSMVSISLVFIHGFL